MKNRVQYLKKIGVWLLFSLVVLWSLGIFAAAEGTIQLSAGETASGTDDTVTVPLVFTRNPGFTSLKIKVTYEKDKFTLTAVESAAVKEATAFQGEEGDEILFLATEDCLEGGTLAELRFKVADGVSKGDYRLDFSAVGAVNAAYEPVGVSFEEGKITLTQDMVLVRSLSFKQEVLTLERNTQSTLEVTVWPENAVNTKLTFQSSDPKVATVTSGGKVTVLSSGETTITVRSSDGKAQADCRITVPEMSGKETFLVVLSELNIGFVQTLKLFFVTLLGAIPLGLLIALCTMSKFRRLGICHDGCGLSSAIFDLVPFGCVGGQIFPQKTNYPIGCPDRRSHAFACGSLPADSRRHAGTAVLRCDLGNPLCRDGNPDPRCECGNSLAGAGR